MDVIGVKYNMELLYGEQIPIDGRVLEISLDGDVYVYEKKGAYREIKVE